MCLESEADGESLVGEAGWILALSASWPSFLLGEMVAEWDFQLDSSSF